MKKKLTLTFIGLDTRRSPVYEDKDGRFFVDADARKRMPPKICTKYRNDFDGEADTPIEYMAEFKDCEVEFVFIPERITW